MGSFTSTSWHGCVDREYAACHSCLPGYDLDLINELLSMADFDGNVERALRPGPPLSSQMMHASEHRGLQTNLGPPPVTSVSISTYSSLQRLYKEWGLG